MSARREAEDAMRAIAELDRNTPCDRCQCPEAAHQPGCAALIEHHDIDGNLIGSEWCECPAFIPDSELDVCGNCGKPGLDGACDSCVELAQREIEQARDNPRGDWL